MSAPSPGPWHTYGEMDAYIADATNTSVATVFNGPQQASNARLIAEAPALLEALKELLADSPEAASRAAAIIARIEGHGKDLKAAEVNHDRRDEGAQAQPAGAAVAPTGQAGGEYSGSAGPPAGLSFIPSLPDLGVWVGADAARGWATGQGGGEHSGSAGSPAGLIGHPGGVPNCRKCGQPAAWVWLRAWISECLLGTGCNDGPNVVRAP